MLAQLTSLKQLKLGGLSDLKDPALRQIIALTGLEELTLCGANRWSPKLRFTNSVSDTTTAVSDCSVVLAQWDVCMCIFR